MKHGVSAVPRAKRSRPRRAAPEVARMSNWSAVIRPLSRLSAQGGKGRPKPSRPWSASAKASGITGEDRAEAAHGRDAPVRDALHFHETQRGAGRLDRLGHALLI